MISNLLKYFLGLEVMQSEEGGFVYQKKYVAVLLKKFDVAHCEVAATPMNINEKSQYEDRTDKANPRLFRSLVDGLNYLTHTRSNISFSVIMMSRFLYDPT